MKKRPTQSASRDKKPLPSTPRWRASIAATLGFSAALVGCGGAELGASSEPESEGVESVSQATLGPACTSTKTTRCWLHGWSGPNFSTFDFASGLACGVRAAGNGSGGYTYRQVLCNTALGSLPNAAGWGQTNSEAPNDIKSIAIQRSYTPSTSILILGSDNVVRATSGMLSSTWYGGTNFKNYSEYVKAVDSNGASICLSKIVVSRLPSPSLPVTALVGLSCSGKLYYAKQQGSSRVWFAGSSAAPWNKLSSSLSFSDMGHDDGEWGLYLLEKASAKRVFRVGKGTFDSSGNLTWSAAEQLPNLYDSWNNQIHATAIGGRFIITDAGGGNCTGISQPCAGDDDRFFKFSGSSWVNTHIGTPSYPENQGMVDTDNLFRKIVDASSFVSSDGESIGVWHVSSRLYTFHWP